MKLLILCTLVAAVCSANHTQCCLSHKYNADVFQVGAVKQTGREPHIIDFSYNLDYDFDQKKIMVVGTTVDAQTGKKQNLSIYDDFTAGKRYYAVGHGCHVSPPSSSLMMDPCIPDNFTYEGNYNIGSGANMMVVHTWSGFTADQMMRITVTDDCIPVTLTSYGSTADGSIDMINTYTFTNFRPGQLSNADPFATPDPCLNDPHVVG